MYIQEIWVIDQVWGEDGLTLAKLFFTVIMDQDGVNPETREKRTKPLSRKKNEANILPSWHDRKSLASKEFITWKRNTIFLQDISGILPAQVSNHSTGFSSSCPLMDLGIYESELLPITSNNILPCKEHYIHFNKHKTS